MPRSFPILIKDALSTMIMGALVMAPGSAQAETIKFEDMFRGTTVSAAQCASLDQAVYVSAYGYGICMRYYLSTAGGDGRRAAMYLEGDTPGIAPGTSHYKDKSVAKDVDTRNLIKRAEGLSRSTGQPAVYLARMGVNGSSGHFADRRTHLELKITNLAIDAIKKRHGFSGFDIAGQSGGSTLLAGLLPLRSDIHCAVLGSGLLVAREVETRRAAARNVPALQMFDPQQGLPSIIRNSSARIIVVSDRQDTIVPMPYQEPFVQRLKSARRQVEQFYVQAKDPRHHGVAAQSILIAGECVRGRSREEIAQRLDSTTIAERVSPKEPAPKEQTPQPRRAQLQPAPDTGPTPQRSDEQKAHRSPADGECTRYFPVIGANVTVPCSRVTANN